MSLVWQIIERYEWIDCDDIVAWLLELRLFQFTSVRCIANVVLLLLFQLLVDHRIGSLTIGRLVRRMEDILLLLHGRRIWVDVALDLVVSSPPYDLRIQC